MRKKICTSSKLNPFASSVYTDCLRFCDHSTVMRDNFKVISVTLPSLYNDGDAYFGLEAEISYRLPIPFISHTIILKRERMNGHG